MSEENAFTVESFVKSVALDPSASEPEAIVSEDLKTVKEGDENQRFVASLAALFMNEPATVPVYSALVASRTIFLWSRQKVL